MPLAAIIDIPASVAGKRVSRTERLAYSLFHDISSGYTAATWSTAFDNCARRSPAPIACDRDLKVPLTRRFWIYVHGARWIRFGILSDARIRLSILSEAQRSTKCRYEICKYSRSHRFKLPCDCVHCILHTENRCIQLPSAIPFRCKPRAKDVI